MKKNMREPSLCDCDNFGTAADKALFTEAVSYIKADKRFHLLP